MSRLLVDVGEALYGRQWQSAIARDLGVSDRSVRRWAAGSSSMPAGLHADLMHLVADRIDKLHVLQLGLRAIGQSRSPRPETVLLHISKKTAL